MNIKTANVLELVYQPIEYSKVYGNCHNCCLGGSTSKLYDSINKPKQMSKRKSKIQIKGYFLTSPSMYFSRQMAQSEVELLLSESEAPQLLSRWPFPLALNFLVSIFSKAWEAILFMELCGGEEGGTGSEGISAYLMRHI